jgi:hypothetical protein
MKRGQTQPIIWHNGITCVVRLDVSVHDAHAVTEVERLKQLVEVVADVKVGQCLRRDSPNIYLNFVT